MDEGFSYKGSAPVLTDASSTLTHSLDGGISNSFSPLENPPGLPRV